MALPREKLYTYADFLEGTEDDREELIDGYFYMLASPSTEHQSAIGGLFYQLYNYLSGKQCKVYMSPLDVRLFEKEGDRPEDVYTVVEPDVIVVCDPSKVDKRGIHGAPDMLVEVLSPSTAGHDLLTKFNLYLKAGVREYWIVNTESRTVTSFVLSDGKYVAQASGENDKLKVQVLEDCYIDLSLVFE